MFVFLLVRSLFFNFQRNINKKGLKGNGYMFKEIISLDFEPLERQTKYYDGIRDIMLVQWQQHENMKSGNIYEIADVVRNLSFKQKEKGLLQ